LPLFAPKFRYENAAVGGGFAGVLEKQSETSPFFDPGKLFSALGPNVIFELREQHHKKGSISKIGLWRQ